MDSWQELSASRQWSSDRLSILAEELSKGGSTSFMIVEGGEVAFTWGDINHKSSVASVRKSLIGLLYGIYASEGPIDLDASLGDLGMDDHSPLTDLEKTATVRDLLASRSGIYHPSVYDIAQGRPARGRYPPGSFWFYNNWDFNVLGTIFELQTHENLFTAFASRIAGPLGMQDFVLTDLRYEHGPESRHPVYKMRFSARDLARVGLMCLRQGMWGDQRVVPDAWLRESLRPHSDLGGGRGYGYLWWTAEANAPGDMLHADVPIYYASGLGGQMIIVLPDRDLVVVHRAARVDHGIRHDRMGELLRLALSAKPRT
jgi:CubicO group peptidase (beta-lactamase class C family)